LVVSIWTLPILGGLGLRRAGRAESAASMMTATANL
jgi:hypothetical protein